MSTHVAIVGAYGSAGVAVAERLADDPDVELTLVDDGEPGGGLCILRGCMPSKEVLSAGEHRFAARHDERLSGPLPDVDLEAVVDRKNEHTSNFAAHRRAAVEEIAERDGVTFVRDTARFLDDGRLAVGDKTLDPEYVFGGELGYSMFDDQVNLAVGARNLFDNYPDLDPEKDTFDIILPYNRAHPMGFNGRFLYSRLTVSL